MKGIMEPVETEEIYQKEDGKVAKRIYHSYVILLTEKKGANVKAIRVHTVEKKGTTAFYDIIKGWTENWNVKGIWRLYEDDFRGDK